MRLMRRCNFHRFVFWILWLDVAFLWTETSCDFGFSSHAFELSTPNKYPTAGDEVTLKCRRRGNVNTVTAGKSLLGSEDNVISWEENGRTVLTTNVNERGGCTVIIDSRFTTGATFDSSTGRNRMSDTSCELDGSDPTVKLKIKNWTPAHLSGDRWKCLQFPFAESRSIEILSYVPVTSVSIQQDIDRFSNPSRGTIATCISSPSRPAADVQWYIKNDDGSEVKVTIQADLKENVETDFNGLAVTTSSVLFSHDDDHGINVFCKTTNKRRNNPIPSDILSVIVKYPPTVEIHADPGASVLEDTDVSLHCIANGRPPPSIEWIRRGDNPTEGTFDDFMVISLDPILFLQSVTLKDSGKYECIASNGIGEAVNSPVFLFVREKPDTSDENQSNQADDSNQEDDDDDDHDSVSDSYSGAVVGTVITIVAVLIVVSIIAYLYIRRRWGKHQNIVVHGQRHSINSTTDGQAIYATCSSMTGNSELPPYVDVLPPSYRMSNIANPGYDMVNNTIDCIHHNHGSPRTNGKRPLPSTPPPSSDYGYAEIRESEEEDLVGRLQLNTMPRRAIPSNGNNTYSYRYINRGNNNNGYINGSSDNNNSNNNNNNNNNSYNNTDTIQRNPNNSNNNNNIIGNNNSSYINDISGSGNNNSNDNNFKIEDDNPVKIGDDVFSDSSNRKSLNKGGGSDGEGGSSEGRRIGNDRSGDHEYDHLTNDDYADNNTNNSGTLQIRSIRQEYGGYEVPVLPPLEK